MEEFRFHQPNLDKHNVTSDEVYEYFLDRRALKQRSINGSYTLIARTAEQDILPLAFRVEPDKSIYVFRARSASNRAKRRYQEKGK